MNAFQQAMLRANLQQECLFDSCKDFGLDSLDILVALSDYPDLVRQMGENAALLGQEELKKVLVTLKLFIAAAEAVQ